MDDQSADRPAGADPPLEPAPGPGDAPSPGDAPPPGHGWIVPPPDAGRTRIVPLVVLSVVLAVIGVVGVILFVGSQNNPRDVLARDFGRRLMEMPAFEARYGDVDTAEQAFQVGQELGARAFARLDDQRLLRYWELTRVMWDATDDRVCAAAIRQTVTAAESKATLDFLTEDQYAEMLDLTYQAFEAELQGIPGPPAPSDAALQAAYLALAADIGDERLIEVSNSMVDTTAPDAEVCQAARTFLDGVMDLPMVERAALLRYMAVP
jgi:hypothetical protein